MSGLIDLASFDDAALAAINAGGGLTRTAVKTGAYTASPGDLIPVDTTAGNVTVTLPAAPADKAKVTVKHIIQGGTNTVTVACGGSDVLNKAGGNTTATLTLVNQGATYEYQASTHIWTVTASDLPLSGLNGVYAPGNGVDVRTYGAKGDGTTDDTAAFQAAINAAIAARKALYIPTPAAHYSIRSTLSMRPATGTQFFLDIFCDHGGDDATECDAIHWDGGSNTVVFDVKGWKRSNVQGMRIRVPDGVDNVVVWDLDGDSTYASLSQINWIGCQVSGKTSTNVVAYRIGHSDPTNNTDFSYLTWFGCNVSFANPAPAGTIAYLNEGPNSLDHKWFGGSIYNTDKGITNAVTTGAHASAYTPGPTLYTYDLGMSRVNTCFEFLTRGGYSIAGGRFELGQLFLLAGNPASPSGPEISVRDVEIVTFTPSDGVVFNLRGSTGAILDNLVVRPDAAGVAADYTAAFITLSGYSASRGSVTIRGGKFRCADPFYTISSGNWSVDLAGARHMDASLGTDKYFRRAYLHGLDTADAISLVNLAGTASGASGTSAYAAFQGTNASGTDSPRTRVGYDSTFGGAVLDSVGSRPAGLKMNGTVALRVNTDGQTQLVGGIRYPVTSPGSFPYTVLVSDYLVKVTTGSAKTLNLPATATAAAGHVVVIKDSTGGANTNNITVTPNGTETIDGVNASKVINTAYGSLRLICDGTGWFTL